MPAPGAKACPDANRRLFSANEVERLLSRVRVGWTTARVRALAGDPESCTDAVWVYRGGPESGPEVTYRLTIRAGVVARIEHSAIACRYFGNPL